MRADAQLCSVTAAEAASYEARLLDLGVICSAESPSYADLQRCPFTEACITESARLYPPGPTMARAAARDLLLGGAPLWSSACSKQPIKRIQAASADVGLACRAQNPKGRAHCDLLMDDPPGQAAVAGAVLLAISSVNSMQFAEDWILQDADRFLPERWLEGTPEAAARPPHAWAAFGDALTWAARTPSAADTMCCRGGAQVMRRTPLCDAGGHDCPGAPAQGVQLQASTGAGAPGAERRPDSGPWQGRPGARAPQIAGSGPQSVWGPANA